MTPNLIAAGINHLLAQDTAESSRLAAHAGKIVRIDAGVIDLRLMVEPGGSVRPADPAVAPDLSIFIKAGDLPLLLQDRSQAFSFARVDGDAELASVLSQLVNNVELDPEDELSRVFGELAAPRIAATARKGWSTARSVHKSVMENMAEYLLEENPTLVRRQSLRDFGVAVSDLRDDVERLAKRLEKIKGRA